MVFNKALDDNTFYRVLKAQFMELGFTPAQFSEFTIDDIGDFLSYTSEKNKAEKFLSKRKIKGDDNA